ncbi:hypothetical protein [Dyadobacter sp. CY347]|uniref:hypothetical protein n=1 Tax=Dyadobacter sp. CY347 TaxID=2909336 RepID=UPI001F262489|nr:hypothetical protein [Dyadobacter sp. CY347]MCF2489686.1 hypothetical protein [Dyadobacter sp. CY347]
MSSQITKEEVTRIMGRFQAKYGYEMDEWTAIILTELNDRFNSFAETVESSRHEIGNATKLVKGQIHPVHFSSNMQAFIFSIGKFLIPSLVALVGIIITAYFVGQSEKYKAISEFVERYPNFDSFRQMIKVADVREFKSKKYLVLRPAANLKSMAVGKEYQYLKTERVVVVPLEPDTQ